MNSKQLYEKAKKFIPGANQLLSKRPEMFGPHWPAYYKKADGIEITDYDGNTFLDFAYMGIGTCLLGYNSPEINSAVNRAIHYGNMSTLNCYEEVFLAELLADINNMDMVRYARTGGEAMTVAIRIARASTNRDIILFSGYHGWHDWYLSANINNPNGLDNHLRKNLVPNGVPEALAGTSQPIKFNDIEDLELTLQEYGNRIAAIVIEPIRYEEPNQDWIKALEKARKKHGFVLIADEITSGLRFNYMSAAKRYGINPDILVYGKALGNGFPISAIVGKREVMDATQDTFISSTYWTERTGFAAALATLKAHKDYNAHKIIKEVGECVVNTWRVCKSDFNIDIDITGQPELPLLVFKENALENKTLFIQEMLKQGFLSTPNFYPTMAHDYTALEKYALACYNTFDTLNHAKLEGYDKYIVGGMCSDKVERL